MNINLDICSKCKYFAIKSGVIGDMTTMVCNYNFEANKQIPDLNKNYCLSIPTYEDVIIGYLKTIEGINPLWLVKQSIVYEDFKQKNCPYELEHSLFSEQEKQQSLINLEKRYISEHSNQNG